MQYHQVRLNFEFEEVNKMIVWCGSAAPNSRAFSMKDASILVDYIYLDSEERRRFAQVGHEYLIEQVQFTGEETINSANNKIRLNFNHPVKELVWVARLEDAETECQWSNFTDGVVGSAAYAGGNPMVDAKLQLNGHDRFQTRLARYFNLVQPYQHHTNIPATGIYVYSFALKPEEHQPSGTANFSRIDNATFLMTFNPALFLGIDGGVQLLDGKTITLLIYAVNYNVLRIMSGIKLVLLKMYITCSQQLAAFIVAFQTILGKQCKKCSESLNDLEYNQLVCF